MPSWSHRALGLRVSLASGFRLGLLAEAFLPLVGPPQRDLAYTAAGAAVCQGARFCAVSCHAPPSFGFRWVFPRCFLAFPPWGFGCSPFFPRAASNRLRA